MKKIIVTILAICSFIYMLNPTAGIFELIPDNIPIIGNIDEGIATYVLLSCIEYLTGKRLGFLLKNKK